MKSGRLRTEIVPPKLARRLSRNIVYSTPPPLPLISLPPDDEWEEFDTPTRSGFSYTLPHVDLRSEEFEDTPVGGSRLLGGIKRDLVDHERPKICHLLSEYMSHNENFQTQRHGFGIDTRLIYKRCKDKDAVVPPGGIGPLDTVEDLRFSALFESGNLDRAYRVNGRHYASSSELLGAASHGTSSPHSQPPFAFFVKVDMEYDLYCDTDLNTHGHIQWYFFRVTLPAALKQTHPRLKVRFNIRNMLKKSSLYNEGMLPTVYVEAPRASQRGWHHAGSNVCYYKNADTYRNHKSGKVQNYYTLSFVYEFAPCSTASGSTAGDDKATVRRILCKTIAGNNCDLLTITDFTQEDSQDQPHHLKRTGIFLSARAHPGESNSSFIMHGIIDFLTGSSLQARYLPHNFVFKVVPMLNPDGVIHGNYRCSLVGTDLNRRWMQPSPDLHPTIFATKLAILSMAKTRPISLYCDIHGHSRKKNMFLYGCRPFESNCRTEAARLRLFPHVLGKTSSSQHGGFYSFSDCTFSKEAQVLHSFTLEASFYGVGANKKQHTESLAAPDSVFSSKHFTPFDLCMAGTKFCHALLPFSQMINIERAQARASTPDPPDDAPSNEEPQPCTSFPLRPQSARTTAETADVAITVPFVPATSPNSLNNKLRLAPLQQSTSPLSNPMDADELLLRPLPLPKVESARSPIGQFLSQAPASVVSVTPLPAATASLSFPPEFGQLFADDSMSAMFSLADPEDLLKEIEASLPDNLLDSGDDDAFVGSESDPSGDNMEEEELRSADSWKGIRSTPEDDTSKEPIQKLPRTRPLRVTRHLSEPRIQQSFSLKAVVDREDTPPLVESKRERPLREPAITKTLAPLRIPSKQLPQKLRFSKTSREVGTEKLPHCTYEQSSDGRNRGERFSKHSEKRRNDEQHICANAAIGRKLLNIASHRIGLQIKNDPP